MMKRFIGFFILSSIIFIVTNCFVEVKLNHLIFSILSLVCSLCLAYRNKLNEEYEKDLTRRNLCLFSILIFFILFSYFFYEYKGNIRDILESKYERLEPFINAVSSTFIMASLFVFSAISKFKSK